MSVSYDYYKLFYYVANYRSFNKAAAVLSNSQPNISRAIANLESQLGCKLFIRSSSGVTLTEEGEELYSHVEAAFKHLTAGEAGVKAIIEKENKNISIGLSMDLTQSSFRDIIVPVMKQFRNEYPDVRIEIKHDTTAALAQAVGDNLMDIAFITTPYDESITKHNYKKRCIRAHKDIVVAGNAFSNLKGKKLSLSAINEYPLVGIKNKSESYDFYNHLFAMYGLEYKPTIETINMDQAMTYTAENQGISFIHPEDAEEPISQGKIFKIKLKEVLPTRYLAFIRNTKDKKIALAFEKFLFERIDTHL
ncbi:MAG: LysR family transcriptional regulator [Lachnospiraceae bacterium]|nr:LysR family transcriptional regulator [Lachnospiraceae bacterium]